MAKTSSIIAIATSLALAGCAGDDLSVGVSAAALVRDVNVTLMQADGGEEDGTILWELLEAADGGEEDGTILWELLEAAEGGEQDGTVLWEIVETVEGGEEDGTILWELLEPVSGQALCEVRGGALIDVRTGQRLLTARGGDVYAISSRAPTYVFVRDQVLRGDGSLLLTTDPAQERASDGRKLIIGALLAGHCR